MLQCLTMHKKSQKYRYQKLPLKEEEEVTKNK